LMKRDSGPIRDDGGIGQAQNRSQKLQRSGAVPGRGDAVCGLVDERQGSAAIESPVVEVVVAEAVCPPLKPRSF
jgi:hypothetical protein